MVTTIGPQRTRSYGIRECNCKVLDLWWSTLQMKLPTKGVINKTKLIVLKEGNIIVFQPKSSHMLKASFF